VVGALAILFNCNKINNQSSKLLPQIEYLSNYAVDCHSSNNNNKRRTFVLLGRLLLQIEDGQKQQQQQTSSIQRF